jgi:chlorobactene glucosyltransferase
MALVLFEAAVAVAALGAVVFQGWAILLAYEMPRLEPLGGELSPFPTVSVVIAARDEEEDLGPTLDALLRQDLAPLEILVVDGGSTDGTRPVAEARGPRVRWMAEPPLPPDWVGKNWACWRGAQATTGAWLLFLDADVRLHPAALRTTVAWAEREGAALASIAPRIDMVGRWERLVLPFYAQMVLTYFRAPHANRPGSRAAIANGQYTLLRRSDYFDLGGHEAVRGALLEDVALARRVRAAGRRLAFAWAPTLAETRMYRTREELSEGILKSIHGGTTSSAEKLGFLVGLVGFFWLPLGVLPLGLALGSLPLAAVGGVAALACFGKHVAFTRAVGAPAGYGLLYPVAVAVYLVLVARSLARGMRGAPVRWKGRVYVQGRRPVLKG